VKIHEPLISLWNVTHQWSRSETWLIHGPRVTLQEHLVSAWKSLVSE